ncbi:hypothetical protein CL653_03115 [bacterium]|nr:hypothetical protein [bacterium]
MEWLHSLIYVGLSMSILSGVYLFADRASYLLTLPTFYMKMALVGALILNSLVIGHHLPLATSQHFRDISRRQKSFLYISATVSTVAWVGIYFLAHTLN